MYVSNTSTDEILTIPLKPDGTAGEITVRYHLNAPDDFAIARNGDLYVAENVPNQLVRVTPGGTITTLATATDGLSNPSAALFGTLGREHSRLYVTNSSYFGSNPSLQITKINGSD
jgi:sugar lactone lactonase YvrE